MVVPSAKTDFVGDFRRKTYHLHFTSFLLLNLKVLGLLCSTEHSICSPKARHFIILATSVDRDVNGCSVGQN